MGIKKTLGGDRLGSGNRMKQEMHDFYRSNKNLSTTIATTMAPGVLYPIYTNVALKGDTFDINLNAFVRTIPTIGPLYGSFKLQVDVFQVPFRLYQAILHNNTTDVARKMNQVYLPQVLLKANVNIEEIEKGFKDQINTSALMRYLNNAGVATPYSTADFNNGTEVLEDVEMQNERLAIPMLAYYDIFKNYYANKQEENAYVITPLIEENDMAIGIITAIFDVNGTEESVQINNSSNDEEYIYSSDGGINTYLKKITIYGNNLDTNKIFLTLSVLEDERYSMSVEDLKNNNILIYQQNENNLEIIINYAYFRNKFTSFELKAEKQYSVEKMHLQEFPLSNIDDMRKYLLTQWDLGTKVVISETNQNYYPYLANTKTLLNEKNANIYPMNGLVVKAYQSDMFNNWLDTEWVNEITDQSSIYVYNNSFTLDMLNFKKKLYDHLNRLAISGGTYDDWQEATYGDKVWGKTEKPIYCGGMSSEVEFDEVVSTAKAGQEVLGSIAGRGKLSDKRKGGNITIKVGEASVIMAIASLTPRIMYTQGNAWYNTELKTMDDLHKPIFDRIGFQDLMVEQMAWWDRKYKRFEDRQFHFELPANRTSAGKQPAWIQYATDIDRAYGDFAKKTGDFTEKEGGLNYMILSRNYQQDEDGFVKDVTTYIDPQKYNTPFAYQELDAQNFWTFVNMRVKARRKMSNTQIPNV